MNGIWNCLKRKLNYFTIYFNLCFLEDYIHATICLHQIILAFDVPPFHYAVINHIDFICLISYMYFDFVCACLHFCQPWKFLKLSLQILALTHYLSNLSLKLWRNVHFYSLTVSWNLFPSFFISLHLILLMFYIHVYIPKTFLAFNISFNPCIFYFYGLFLLLFVFFHILFKICLDISLVTLLPWVDLLIYF